MRKKQLTITICIMVAAAIPFLFSQQGRAPANDAGAALKDDTASVRIEFGVTDTEPRAWSGSVSASAGSVVSVRNWRPRPGEKIEGNSWTLATKKGVNFVRRAWEADSLTDPTRYLLAPGVIVETSGSSAQLQVTTPQGNFTVTPSELNVGAPRAMLNGAVRVERMPTAEKVSADGSNNDFSSLVALPNGRLMSGWVNFADNRNELHFREFDGSRWSGISKITTHSDVFMVKLGHDRQNRVWAVWSAQVDDNWDIYSARWTGSNWTTPDRLTNDPQPDTYPAMTTDSNGNLWLVWQGFRNGKADIFTKRYTGETWTESEKVSTSPANDWLPAIAADKNGAVHVAWDTYDKGNYDIVTRRWDRGTWGEVAPVANTTKFEAYVSLAVDNQNRLWASWNEGGNDWGKDTGFLPLKQGTALYTNRWMAVAVNDGSGWQEPLSAPETSVPESMRDHNDLPVLQADSGGRVWLSFRHRLLRIQDVPFNTPAHRAGWEVYFTTYEGDKWRPAVQLPFSNGRQDMRYGTAATANGLYASWPTDHRDFEEFLFGRAEVYAGRLPLPAVASTSMKLRPRKQPALKNFPTHYTEAADLARIHSYELDHGGKKYRIVRGDTHRHTEFSMDGNNDGSLLDAYRYAIDAAELDFLLVSDHNGAGGPDNPYPNWLLQQMAAMMTVPAKFVPFYGYERSVGYPNGHRNILFTKRGIPTLPVPASENRGETGAKPLYEYLKQNKGIAISHTSASNMGTDWRDNDKEVEPLVEIFQGDRVSAEYEGAPKAAYASNPASAPGGFRPMGYIWKAWAKGYKLGVQSASDHLSTHISYACTLTSDFTRDGMIDAMKARHSYGATDNIILDYRMKANGKEYLQGDIVDVKGEFSLSIKVLGTAPVRQIDIIRSNQFLLNRQPLEKDLNFEFRDGKPLPGESYYYVRVIQVDEQMAWSSPIWIKRQ